MYITPMEALRPMQEISAAPAQSAQAAAGGMFTDIFRQAVDNVRSTENEVAEVEYQLATGQLDDLHSLTIATSKAAAAGELLVQLRSRALDAYNELMRISL